MNSAAPDLTAVASALDVLSEQGELLIDPRHLDAVAALRGRIDERLRHGEAVTVVAVAGGTGVGKSALVNQLAGTPVATEGVRRPTTDHPLAVARELDEPARALLDMLDIHDRHIVGDSLPPGVIVVDLPDHDSAVAANRATSKRLTGRVDALVVVVDPIKYARADLHHGPLAELRRHADVVTVVLNRSDELSADDLEVCRADLVARLEGDGLGEVRVLTTSAATGAGIDQLRSHLEQLAEERNAVARRLAADGAHLADQITASTGEHPAVTANVDELLKPLYEATDAGRHAAEAGGAYRQTAARACRSPLARLVRLPGRFTSQVTAAFTSPEPGTHPPSRSVGAIETVLARHLDLSQTAGPAHAAMAATIDQVAHHAAPQVVDAVDGIPARPERRLWWTVLAWLRGCAETVTLVGLLWLILLGVAGWLQLPDPPTPMVTDELSLPAALFLYGLASRVILGLITRALILTGAHRHATEVSEQVRRRLSLAVQEYVVEPLSQESHRRDRVRASLALLRTSARDATPASDVKTSR